jgi:hypothetical protein
MARGGERASSSLSPPESEMGFLRKIYYRFTLMTGASMLTTSEVCILNCTLLAVSFFSARYILSLLL